MSGIGLKCIILMGIYCILMIMLWIHMVISLTTQSKNITYFVSRYFTLITSILYSIQPIFAISSSIMYYINPDPSVDSPIAWVVTALYIIPLFMMFALSILRLDITFRKSHFAHKREHIKIIWCIYVFVILLFIITIAFFTIQLDIPAIILASISIVLFLSFIITLFVMFIKKLKQIALATEMASESKFVSNLAFKLTILFSFSILSSVIGMILASIVAVFFDNNPDIFYYLSDLVLSTDASMLDFIPSILRNHILI